MAELGWSCGQIAKLVHGELNGSEFASIDKVAIDSREDVRGALYVALKGSRFDGHDFVSEAASRGAAAVMAERTSSKLPIPLIAVKDSLAALQALGLARRREFKGPVIAITGSTGKTTTRRMVASILSTRYKTLEPRRNFNNHVGVPLTLLEIERDHEAAVIELGCSDFGEIALLTKLTDPDVALVTNVGMAHLEKLGDLDGVARAKGELFAGLRSEATAVVNADDPRVASMPAMAKRKISFSARGKAEVRLAKRTSIGNRGQKIWIDIRGETAKAELRLLGFHNAANAVAASAAAAAVGLGASEVEAALPKISAEHGRLSLLEIDGGVVLIDDTYNANPTSTGAAIDVLVETAGEKRGFAVLGDMLELGGSFEQAHLSIGGAAASSGVFAIVGVGKGGELIARGAAEAGMPAERAVCAASRSEAAKIARSMAAKGDVVLVKGSRGMRMEEVVAELERGAKR